MAETAKIALMADKVSKEVFETFGWTRVSTKDANWTCAVPHHHKSTHPSDVVYCYDDPYEDERVFINLDLKSYAKNSIQKDKVAGAIKSLAMATECANVSPGWSDLYALNVRNWVVAGGLFVYNHDGAYDREVFPKKLAEVHERNFELPLGRRMYIFSPGDVEYLHTVAFDIVYLRGKKEIADAPECRFFFPDLIRTKRRTSETRAATAEMLLGPWQVLRFRCGGASLPQTVVYYRGAGPVVDDYKYLIDYLFRYQLIAESSAIRIRAPFANTTATAAFDRARLEYVELSHPRDQDEFRERLDEISFESVTNVVPRFSDVELGMEPR